ncbi:2-C-methyl-D-erythritol 4-phosphate cytidylyltransferase [Shewanella violacea]|uniref:2-C-methyl-D-erythritol 4-phosphate cytidylyltransferase n=1 Tax=Shewanella violacea (strain JCM 10179 / CIP 106290 / LMG 19151 / DSS12) TaxID=637905 RepID=D4ZAU9_SHEVD|nr:2-C-methyl-D-erythritol 4-phosphate cytidylyltransferase [Shewanella violacea]BAJ03144.1 4-diphosphocytidyl-2C-methyl-D-erythritol synthase [Shewanella violacea DSS12]
MNDSQQKIVAIVPAAGIGSRMGADVPKQYLKIAGQSILSLTLQVLLTHPRIDRVILALHPQDSYFSSLPEAKHPKLLTVVGGEERANSVLSCLNRVDEDCWAMVHDAARPCLAHSDIDKLIDSRVLFPQGAILASPVRDTMKRGDKQGRIEQTVCREQLWHALTPQLFPVMSLRENLSKSLKVKANITDEASAMEWAGIAPGLVTGRADNIKITHPDDLRLAELFLSQGE